MVMLCLFLEKKKTTKIFFGIVMNFSTIGNAIKECFLKFKSKQSCGRWTLKMRDKSQTEKRFEPEIPSPSSLSMSFKHTCYTEDFLHLFIKLSNLYTWPLSGLQHNTGCRSKAGQLFYALMDDIEMFSDIYEIISNFF